jgi:hypothetical protein
MTPVRDGSLHPIEQVDTSPTSAKSEGNQPIAGRKVLVALGMGLAIAAPAGLATGFGLPRVVPALSSADWLGTIISAEVYLALVIGHAIAFGGFRRMHERLRVTRPPWRDVRLALAVFLLTWSVLAGAYWLLRPVLGVVDDMGLAVVKIGSLYGRLDGASPALLVAAMIQPILITPYFEEILFRGSMFRWLRGKANAAPTILITSAVFAMYHPLIVLWPLAFLFGLAAGWVRERTQSVTPFLVMHVLNSILMIVAAYFISGWRVIQ